MVSVGVLSLLSGYTTRLLDARSKCNKLVAREQETVNIPANWVLKIPGLSLYEDSGGHHQVVEKSARAVINSSSKEVDHRRQLRVLICGLRFMDTK